MLLSLKIPAPVKEKADTKLRKRSGFLMKARSFFGDLQKNGPLTWVGAEENPCNFCRETELFMKRRLQERNLYPDHGVSVPVDFPVSLWMDPKKRGRSISGSV